MKRPSVKSRKSFFFGHDDLRKFISNKSAEMPRRKGVRYVTYLSDRFGLRILLYLQDLKKEKLFSLS